MIRITSNVDTVIAQLKRYRDGLNAKIHTMLERLAAIGVDVAEVQFRTARYDGNKDIAVSGPVWISDNKLVVTASGSSVLFVEFGSGIQMEEHPLASEFGYGPGTWSDNEALGGKHHWDDPKGWYYEHGKKSHGNPPARAMYDAGKEMRKRIIEIAREVFSE